MLFIVLQYSRLWKGLQILTGEQSLPQTVHPNGMSNQHTRLALKQISSFQILIFKQTKSHPQPSEPPGSFCPELLRIAKPIKINRFMMLTAFSALGPFMDCLPKKKEKNSKSTEAGRPVAKTSEVTLQEILEGSCSQWAVSCGSSQPCSPETAPQGLQSFKAKLLFRKPQL